MSENRSRNVNLPVLLGIIILVILMAAGTSFLVMYLFNTAQANNGEPRAVFQFARKGKTEVKMGPIYSLGVFTVNMSGTRTSGRFIRTDVVLELEKEDTIKELEERAPQIRDAVIEILRSQRQEDIDDPALTELKAQLLNKLNEILVKGKVKSVWLTDFVIQ